MFWVGDGIGIGPRSVKLRPREQHDITSKPCSNRHFRTLIVTLVEPFKGTL